MARFDFDASVYGHAQIEPYGMKVASDREGELTEPGRMRHPVWHGLRPDKSPDEVVWEG